MRVNGYQIVVLPLAQEQGGGFFVTVPQLPGCVAEGQTREEAVHYTESAIETSIAVAGILVASSGNLSAITTRHRN